MSFNLASSDLKSYLRHGMKVHQFDAKIINLVQFVDHKVMDDEWLARMFERGLKPSIKPYLPCETITCVEVWNVALMVERDIEKYQKVQ